MRPLAPADCGAAAVPKLPLNAGLLLWKCSLRPASVIHLRPASARPCCRQAAAEDFEEHVLPLLARYPGRLRHPGFVTLGNFQMAAAYVASRAFGVDEWHGG